MKKAVIISVSTLLIVVSLFIGYYFMFINNKEVTAFLNGNNNIVINVFDNYQDEGVILKSNNSIIDKSKYLVNVDNKLNINVIGNYVINYEINYKKNNYHLNRNIMVVDKINPIISLSTNEVVMDYCTKKVKKDITFNALDNYDGDLTNNVEIIKDDNSITYKVSDSSGNTDERIVNIKYESKPNDKFYLKGSKKIYVTLNSIFTDPGVVYSDGCGNTISKEIEINGEVDTTKEGTYFIFYKVDDKSLSREVVVSEKNSNKPKTIYLTFDDGPGTQTQKILDTLNKYNVKATFFVTHQFPKYLDLIKSEHQSGHTVAVHTYTHKYENVYTSVDGYIDDFNKMNEIIKNYTGTYTNLFRFPGGSSNTVSKKYSKGIVTQIANEMTKRGYYYFDWNVDSKDAAGANQKKVYDEVVNGVERCTTCVVLMHDIKVSTANALDDILATLTSKGYTFKTLSSSSPAIRHHINN